MTTLIPTTSCRAVSAALTALLLLAAASTGATAQVIDTDSTYGHGPSDDAAAYIDSDSTYDRGPSDSAFADLQAEVKRLVNAVATLVEMSLWRPDPAAGELKPSREW